MKQISYSIGIDRHLMLTGIKYWYYIAVHPAKSRVPDASKIIIRAFVIRQTASALPRSVYKCSEMRKIGAVISGKVMLHRYVRGKHGEKQANQRRGDGFTYVSDFRWRIAKRRWTCAYTTSVMLLIAFTQLASRARLLVACPRTRISTKFPSRCIFLALRFSEWTRDTYL